jgi:hypothetical protein
VVRSSKNAPRQEFVWPPPESEVDSYILLLKPGALLLKPAATFLPIGAPDVVTAPEIALELQRPERSDWSGESALDVGLDWLPSESELDHRIDSFAPISVLAKTQSCDPVTAPQAITLQTIAPQISAAQATAPQATLPQTAASEAWLGEGATVSAGPIAVAQTASSDSVGAPQALNPVPLSLSQVLHSNVALHWHEAVAVVRQLADQLTHGLSYEPAGSIPGIDGIELQSMGRLRARLDPSGTVTLVRGLGHLLHTLLADTDAPVRLRLIVSQAVSEVPTFPSVERLTWELAGFERPRRLETLNQLYERTCEAIRTRPMVLAAVGRNTPAASHPIPSRTAAVTTEATEETDGRAMALLNLSPRALTLALASGAVCVALVIAALLVNHLINPAGSESTPSSQAVTELLAPRAVNDSPTSQAVDQSMTAAFNERDVPDAREQPTDSAWHSPALPAVRTDASPRPARGERRDEPVRPAVRTLNSAATSGAVGPPPTGELPRFASADVGRSMLPAVPQSAQQEYRRARTLFEQREYAAATDAFQHVIKILGDAELTGPSSELRSMALEYATLSRGALSATIEAPVYSSGDEGVTEPVLLRSYLPGHPAPGTPPSRLGVLKVVVNGRGAVESVRLQSPSNRYHDRFWVSVAKTWRFQPALKDGHPVKFLKSIVITDPPLSDPQ